MDRQTGGGAPAGCSTCESGRTRRCTGDSSRVSRRSASGTAETETCRVVLIRDLCGQRHIQIQVQGQAQVAPGHVSIVACLHPLRGGSISILTDSHASVSTQRHWHAKDKTHFAAKFSSRPYDATEGNVRAETLRASAGRFLAIPSHILPELYRAWKQCSCRNSALSASPIHQGRRPASDSAATWFRTDRTIQPIRRNDRLKVIQAFRMLCIVYLTSGVLPQKDDLLAKGLSYHT